jgi:acyl phosphate:glycerol-3-phosphate acyltransferase
VTDTVAAVIIGYLLGSLPFGYWAGRLKGVDLRLVGSGNTGGTNAIRVLGARYGVPVILLDMAKGVVAVLIARELAGVTAEVLAATAAVLGHAFPVFLRFRGGKAVAVGAGAMFALTPVIGVLVTLVWFIVAATTRYVSLASLATAVAFPTLTFVFDEPWPVRLFALAGGLFVIWRHRSNIARLRSGTEHRINLRRSAEEPV